MLCGLFSLSLGSGDKRWFFSSSLPACHTATDDGGGRGHQMTKTTDQGLQLLKFINVLIVYSEVGKVLYITI